MVGLVFIKVVTPCRFNCAFECLCCFTTPWEMKQKTVGGRLNVCTRQFKCNKKKSQYSAHSAKLVSTILLLLLFPLIPNISGLDFINDGSFWSVYRLLERFIWFEYRIGKISCLCWTNSDLHESEYIFFQVSSISFMISYFRAP